MKKTPKQHQMRLQPAPQIIVSLRDENGRNNAQSVGYTENVSTEPDMIMVTISPTRFTHHIIKDTSCSL